MDPWIVISLGLAVTAIVVAGIAIRNARALTRSLAANRRLRADVSQRDDEIAGAAAEQAVLGEAVGSGIVRVDRSLRVISANAVAHTLLGRTPGTLVGRSVMEAFLDASVESMAQAALANGTARTEVRRADADGPMLTVLGRRAHAGGLWLIVDDVSELRRLQRIRTEFIDNLSHELRTPLTTVSLLAETLSREADGPDVVLPPKMRDRIGKIEVETGHLVQMVNELLDLSRIESGDTLALVDGLDMGRLAAQSAERLRLFADRQGVTLRVEAPDGLPPVRGDSARLGQVVVNLVHNAVKFSPDGGEILVRADREGADIVTSVQDHGVGIPRDAQDRVFERFYKVDRARMRAETGGGTGLGLAIARHVVEQHGGRIWVESSEGSGSTFSFALPVAGNGDH
ncbi:MAG: multi-sensor signal transduction histidine kinase [Chloroflexota bacterium]|nr:multi-sensor signal transduction histidine kinase [Chloroflexota bacterium]